jgi:hypothetical protein
MTSSRAVSLGVVQCPACGGPLNVDANWCPRCNFTGGDTVAMFSDPPPPLLPILDAAGILKENDLLKIESARESLRSRFPQFHWRVCTVILPPESSLSLFGFWLLNACPLLGEETLENRASTVLLLINADSGQVTAVPGYAVESYLSDDTWKLILSSMTEPWRSGKPGEAIVCFFTTARSHLEIAWKRYGTRISTRN